MQVRAAIVVWSQRRYWEGGKRAISLGGVLEEIRPGGPAEFTFTFRLAGEEAEHRHLAVRIRSRERERDRSRSVTFRSLGGVQDDANYNQRGCDSFDSESDSLLLDQNLSSLR